MLETQAHQNAEERCAHVIAALERCNLDLDARNDRLRDESERRQQAEQEVLDLKNRAAADDRGNDSQNTKRMRRRLDVLEEQLKSESALRIAAEKKADHASKLKRQLLAVSSTAAELDQLNAQVEALQKRLQSEGETRRKAEERCDSISTINGALERRLRELRVKQEEQ